MAFQLPTFNVPVDIYRNDGTGGTYGAPDVTAMANMTPGKRVMLGAVSPTIPFTLITLSGGVFMELLLPALTDIRANWNAAGPDLVEAPSGSKRFYHVAWVDDIAKGFPNEHRIAWIGYKVAGDANLAGGPFPAPAPLP